MKKWLIFLAAAMFVLVAFRPEKLVVTGIVTDQQNTPITGATVSERSTNNSVFTDKAGKFSIAVSSSNATLLIAYVGYNASSVKVKTGGPMHIKLNPSTSKLEEVVVTGNASAPDQALASKSYGTEQGILARPGNRTYEKTLPSQFNTEDYDAITENRFHKTSENPLSTFSIDVDAASYSNVRRFLVNGQLPPPGAVRTEELINYFRYEYPQPKNDLPFSINTEIGACPWNTKHQLVLIGLQGQKIPTTDLPASNLVFLIDVSGSMQAVNKLALVKSSMKLLVDQLRENDKVSIVVYAGSAGLVLNPTRGDQKTKIKDAIERLEAGGSTAGGEGIRLAYNTARENFVRSGNNRVILCTDGDFNVGVSSDASLESLIETERKSGVYLTVLGYGMGNYKDNKMQKLADKGNGNHAYIDSEKEAKKVLVNEFGGTLFTIAKDVKLQVEFNPVNVQAYRLIGYENRMLNQEDFNNEKKDAGELGSGHTVTALYEVIPTGEKNDFEEKVDPLKYSQHPTMKQSSAEILTVKFRYKNPHQETSQLIEQVVMNEKKSAA
ncbi:MAG TPA: von Willebrand factor type A domain-containing protein, partial [Flavitalea sp.]|nr:von Willebrand factor type A domain-containing protein [Flavitalea sp.]